MTAAAAVPAPSASTPGPVPIRLDTVPAAAGNETLAPWAFVGILAILAALLLFFTGQKGSVRKGSLPAGAPHTVAAAPPSTPAAATRPTRGPDRPADPREPAIARGPAGDPEHPGPAAGPAQPAAAGDDERTAIGEIPSRQIVPAEKIDDPRQDGWDTEVFNERAGKQLKKLGALLADPAHLASADLARLASPTYHSPGLRPEPLSQAYADTGVTVRRSSGPTEPPAPAGSARGVAGLHATLDAQARVVAQATGIQYKFKIFRVIPGEGWTDTVADFEISGRTADGTVQVNATWHLRWVAGPDAETPLVEWITVPDYEEVTARAPQGTLFSDVTRAVLGANASFPEQLVHSYNHWWTRVEYAAGFNVFVRCGLAVGDVNGDGLDDVYLCQPAGLPNRLFVQNPDGTATDRSAESGLDYQDLTASALFLDLDADGDQDLVLTLLGRILLLANDGTGRFREVRHYPTAADTQPMAAADYDLDGDLDLFVGVNDGWQAGRTHSPMGNFVYHDATDGGPNTLFRNDGDFTFTDVTAAVGLDADNHRHSLAACWEDYDDDGDPDLYVANDYGPNHLWRNDGGRFVDVAKEVGAEDYGSGMSAHWGDYDRDGDFDLYVANMWSSAGGRVTWQDKFRSFEQTEIKKRWQRFAKGNTLLRNRGDGRFEEVSTEAAVEMGRWSWGSQFVDLNNDGWEDLVVANGYLTMEDPADL